VGKSTGKKPAGSGAKLPQAPEPRDYNSETPKFCLHYVHRNFDVSGLTTAQQAALARTFRKLSQSSWKTLTFAGKHGQGTEFIASNAINMSPPPRFEGESRYLVFRYDDVLPMVGVRVDDVFHVLWIEPTIGRLYDHGS
jgi:hypothetical protein